ncbi:rCG22777 [Rattus norvegicus]|uniref:RCG22777 n=1 Tax=Rattus norvegicus TaxID=10116 RepID=A6JYL7_RAT|nr:rCG22777 [Rattus norvegicus]
MTASSGGNINFGYQKCSNFCLNATIAKKKRIVKYACCNSHSFCNAL